MLLSKLNWGEKNKARTLNLLNLENISFLTNNFSIGNDHTGARLKSIDYIPAFDFIRGIAALSVLLLHGSYGFFKGGWIGVDLFFVLSGYLITAILLKEFKENQQINMPAFYIRRSLRLIPALVICILLSNVLWSVTPFYEEGSRGMASLAAFFYFTNIIPGAAAGNMAHLWSLAVEEHFYLLWPVCTSLFLFKLHLKRSVLLLTGLIIIVSMFRIYIQNRNISFANGDILIMATRFTFCRIDGVLLGGTIALINSPGRSRYRLSEKLTMFLTGTCFLVYAIVFFMLKETDIIWLNGGFIFSNLLCGVIIYLTVQIPDHKLFANRIIRWIGIRSYGIYLYHFPVFLALRVLSEKHSFSNYLFITALRFGITFLLAGLSFKYLERPILKLKNNFLTPIKR